jgi:hypothetical protein
MKQSQQWTSLMIMIVSWNWLQMRNEERGLEFLQNRKFPLKIFGGFASECLPGSSNFASGRTQSFHSLSLSLSIFNKKQFSKCNYFQLFSVPV